MKFKKPWYRRLPAWMDIYICRGCGRINFNGVYPKRRTGTAYQNDESNWIVCCDVCFEEVCEQVADLWNTYYGMIRG